MKNGINQHGILFNLKVFRTKSKGWGVRSRSYIPHGSFVCAYIGVILQEEEDASSQHAFFLMLSSSIGADVFVIDATQHGNVGRFVNHSPSPNLFLESVLYDHDDVRMPHMMLFAKKSIPLKQ
ncbi:hypothetical protein ACE6H2_006624 [Prunus campanulata]